MEDKLIEELPPFPFLFVKRPDLRLQELSDEATPEDLAAWKWWLQDMELYEGELADLPIEDRITALGLTTFKVVHGAPDPARILAFFCLCHEWRIYPPAWIMDELYSRFKGYLSDNLTGKNKRRLGEFFGEPARGDRSPFFKNQAFKSVMESTLIAVDRLRYRFNFPKEQALGIASRRFELIVNETGHRFQKGEAALEKAYRNWCNGDHYQSWLETMISQPFTEKENKEFLLSFPEGSFNGYPHIEKLLKD